MSLISYSESILAKYSSFQEALSLHSFTEGFFSKNQFPRSKYWNGPLKYTNISYRCQRGSRKTERKVSLTNSTVRSVALPGIQATDKCYVWMRICNERQLCNAISNICVKPGKLEGESLNGRNITIDELCKIARSII